MGETGENVAERGASAREEQDAFALRSRSGAGRPPTPPAGSPTSWCRSASVERDEHPRPETSPRSWPRCKPAFRTGGTVTAGNSSGINDGAAALVIASEERARGSASTRSACSSVGARPASIRP